MSIVSKCCTAPKWGSGESDICADCKEHADFYDDEVLYVEDLIVGQKYKVIDPVVVGETTLIPIGTILIYEKEMDGYVFRQDIPESMPIVFDSCLTEITFLEEIRG